MKVGFVKFAALFMAMFAILSCIPVHAADASNDGQTDVDVTSKYRVYWTPDGTTEDTSSVMSSDTTFLLPASSQINSIRLWLAADSGSFDATKDYKIVFEMQTDKFQNFWSGNDLAYATTQSAGGDFVDGYKAVTSGSVTNLQTGTDTYKYKKRVEALISGQSVPCFILRVRNQGDAVPTQSWSFRLANVHIYEVSKTEGQLNGILGILGSLGGWIQNIINAITNLPQYIFDKFQSILNTIKSAIDSVVSVITALPDLIMNGLKTLFVPSSDLITSVFDEWNTFLQAKFGFLFMPIEIVESIVYPVITGQTIDRIENEGTMLPYNVFENSPLIGTSGDGLKFPAFTLNLSGQTYTIWEARTIDIAQFFEDNSLGWVLDVIRFITSAFICLNFLRWLIGFLAREFPTCGLFGYIEAFYDSFLSGFDGNIFKGVF